MFKLFSGFLQNVFVCEDPSCTNADRRIPVKLYKGYPGCRCKQALMYKEYNDSQLHKQLSYLCYIFDVTKHSEKVFVPNEGI